MIHFNCPGCGKEFSVREEFGGRATRCPTCQRALVVPAAPDTAAPDTVTEVHRPAAATAAVPPAPPTSVAPAPFKQTSGPPPGRDVASALSPPGNGAAPSGPDEDDGRPRHKGRYRIADEIARGGMGAVVRAVDNDIRREVAIKYMLDHKDARQRARFVEEAQITGQLEHPNIVPVHELGVDDKQRPFFAMKMVRGRSLGQVLEDLSAMSPTAENDWPLGRLTNVLVSVCNALSYAHARGVIHRDLKPANVMIGDFGEVYLMDWGVAKIIGFSREQTWRRRG
ncbi:MAG: serine/threonine-protein kinase [Gemmataceae bacterium]